MHVAIIGSARMLGRKLVERIVREGMAGGREVSRLTLLDAVAPQTPEGFSGPVEARQADLSAPGEAERLVAARPDTIFHLAAIVSAEAELDFDKGYRVNLDGTRLLFEAIRHASQGDSYRPRLVFASSIAVFGAPLPLSLIHI